MFANLGVQRKYISPVKQRQKDKIEYCNCRITSDVEAGAVDLYVLPGPRERI